MARALRIPGSRLRHRSPANSGGSFGSKLTIFPYVVVMCIAARLARRPVKWIEDRLEHLSAASCAPNRVTRVEAAYDDEGIVSAIRLVHWDDHGAYLRAPMPAPIYRMHGLSTNAYRIGHVEVTNHIMVTNKCPTGAVRGFGGPQLYFAVERMMHQHRRRAWPRSARGDPPQSHSRGLVPLSRAGRCAHRLRRLPEGHRRDRTRRRPRGAQAPARGGAAGGPALRHRLCGRGRAQPVQHGLHLDARRPASSASAPARRMARSRRRPSTSIRSDRSASSPIPFRRGRGIRPRWRRSSPMSSACGSRMWSSISRPTRRRTAGRSRPATTPAASRRRPSARPTWPRPGCARSSRASPRSRSTCRPTRSISPMAGCSRATIRRTR